MTEGSPSKRWTCDRCGTTELVLLDAQPSGWSRVRIQMPPRDAVTHDEKAPIDLCSGCTQSVKRFLTEAPVTAVAAKR